MPKAEPNQSKDDLGQKIQAHPLCDGAIAEEDKLAPDEWVVTFIGPTGSKRRKGRKDKGGTSGPR